MRLAPAAEERGAPSLQTLLCVLPLLGSDSGRCLGAPGSNSGTGSQHQMQPDLTTPTAVRRISADAHPFSFVGGRPTGDGQLRHARASQPGALASTTPAAA